jgi:hypothetical protein
MNKTAFFQVVGDNSESILKDVMLSNGNELTAYVEVEGNRTTKVELFLYKIEDEYITIRQHVVTTYDYNGQVSKGEETNVDVYLGYDSVIGLQYEQDRPSRKKKNNKRGD